MQRGYHEALQAAGVPYEESLVLGWQTNADPAQLRDAILSRTPSPSAVICYNEQLAMGLSRALRAAGSRVPEDMAIVGLGNSWIGELAEVPLTSVDFNHTAIARAVVGQLLGQFDNRSVVAKQILVKPHLVARASSQRASAVSAGA